MLVSIEFSNWKVEFNDNTIVIVLGISTIIDLNGLYRYCSCYLPELKLEPLISEARTVYFGRGRNILFELKFYVNFVDF